MKSALKGQIFQDIEDTTGIPKMFGTVPASVG
jgi:hypothetical protein